MHICSNSTLYKAKSSPNFRESLKSHYQIQDSTKQKRQNMKFVPNYNIKKRSKTI